ncbi:MAG: flagellar hook-length control protein FliK [Nitrosospira sp.]|nr:flagellar hook-length control protein FliK [Nitrosospira sp.]
MILTPPMLQNSSTNSTSPIRNATDSAGGEAQPPGTASFGKVLANEMNDKKDVAETKQGEASALEKGPEKKDTAVGDVKDLEDPEKKDSRELKTSKDLEGSAPTATETRKKTQTKTRADAPAAALATSPQPMNLADILHGLIAAYSPATPVEKRIALQTETPKDTPVDARAVGAAIDAQAALTTTADPQAGLAVMSPGLVAAHPAKAESDASGMVATVKTELTPWSPGMHAASTRIPDASGTAASGTSASGTAATAKSDLTPRSVGMRAAAATQMREKHAAGIQDIQERMAIKFESEARQNALQQVEFSLPEITVATKSGKSENSLLELASKDLQVSGLFNASAAPTGVATDRGIAPVATGSPVYAGLSLEPRVGATGWDNALGQKVLWMVSQQQQVVELTLNPPDLGPLQVILSINNDQASATFVSPHADVRQALEAALPRLREMMADSGISLGNTTVSADTSQQQSGFERQDRSSPRHGGSGATMIASSGHGADTGMSHIHSAGSRLVDIFA